MVRATCRVRGLGAQEHVVQEQPITLLEKTDFRIHMQ